MTSLTIDRQLITLWLREMVRINSVNPVLAEGGVGESVIADWLVKVCEDLGFDAQKQETAPGRPNVIAHRRGTGGMVQRPAALVEQQSQHPRDDVVVSGVVPRYQRQQ